MSSASKAWWVGQPRDDEDSLSSVGGAHIGCTKSRPLRIVPERGKVSENSLHPPNKERCHIFNDDESRSKNANDPCELAPESAPLSLDAHALSGVTDVLARVTGTLRR